MTASSSALHDCHVLVVEDNYMIAQDTAEALLETGARVIGPVPSLREALYLAIAEDRIDCAVLDVNLRDEVSWPLVDVLLARGVPLLLATGCITDFMQEIWGVQGRKIASQQRLKQELRCSSIEIIKKPPALPCVAMPRFAHELQQLRQRAFFFLRQSMTAL
jgi:CheY-like chemotaxis protein